MSGRIWRQRMQAAAAEWLDRFRWRDEPGARLLTEPELRDLMHRSFCAGFEAGRKPPEET